MTVAALASSINYIENGVTLGFAAPFRFLANSIAVSRVLVDGTVVDLAAGVDFSTTGGSTDAGGTVTLVSSVAGATLRIRRVTPRTQAMDYTPGDRFPAESHEAAIDRAMLIDQEQDDKIGDTAARALMVPDGEIADVLPTKADRANRTLAFDADGKPIVSNGGPGADQALRGDLADPNSAGLGGELIKFDATNLKAWLNVRTPSVHDYYAGVGVGNATIDQAAFAAAIAAGGVHMLKRNGSYKLKRGLLLPSNGGFVSDGQATIELQTGAGEFDYARYGGGDANGLSHIALHVYQKSNVRLARLKFTFEAQASVRCCKPIAFRDCDEGLIDDVVMDFSLLAQAVPFEGMIGIQSCRGTELRNIIGKYAHYSLALGTLKDASNVDTPGNTTLIEIDGSRPNGNSDNVKIANIEAYDFERTGNAALQANGGQQSDCLNIQSDGEGSVSARGVKSYKVGETLDVWAAGVTIVDVRAKYTFLDPIKIIHGGQRISITDAVIDVTGNAAVHLNNQVRGDCQNNRISGVVATNVGQLHAAYCPWLDPACGVLFDGGNVTSTYVRNNLVEGEFHGYQNGGTWAMECVVRQLSQGHTTAAVPDGTATAYNNRFSGNGTSYRDAGSHFYFSKSVGGGGVMYLTRGVKPQVEAHLSADTGYANGATILYDAEDYDPTGGYDPSTGIFTADCEGSLEVIAQARCASLVSGKLFGLALVKNGAEISNVQGTGNGDAEAPSIRRTVRVVPGDQLKIIVKTNVVGTATVTGSAGYTYLQIREVPA